MKLQIRFYSKTFSSNVELTSSFRQQEIFTRYVHHHCHIIGNFTPFVVREMHRELLKTFLVIYQVILKISENSKFNTFLKI
jgi:hypothetical protein